MRRRLKIILVLLWLLVIFSFSAQPDIRSYEVSGSVSYQLVKCYNHLMNIRQTPEEMEQTALLIEYPVRKAAHMSEYAVLAILFLVTYCAYSKRESGVAGIWFLSACALLSVFGCACLDEFHQLFVQGREGKFTDVLIDSSGAAAALLVAGLIMTYKENKKRKR